MEETRKHSALKYFRACNARFLRGKRTSPQDRAPKFALLTCADSRIDPRRIFDAKPRKSFSTRNADNVASSDALESLAHAVETGAEAVVVLGLSDCKATKAVLAAAPGYPTNSEAIRSHPKDARDPSAAANVHARATAKELALALDGRIPVLAAMYRTETEEVEQL